MTPDDLGWNTVIGNFNDPALTESEFTFGIIFYQSSTGCWMNNLLLVKIQFIIEPMGLCSLNQVITLEMLRSTYKILPKATTISHKIMTFVNCVTSSSQTIGLFRFCSFDLFILNRIINKQLDSIFCFNDFMIFLPHNILFLLRLDGRVAVLEPGSRRRERSKTSEDLSPAVAGVGLGTGRKQDGGQIRANHFEFSKPNNLSQCSRVFFHLKEFCNIIKC